MRGAAASASGGYSMRVAKQLSLPLARLCDSFRPRPSTGHAALPILPIPKRLCEYSI
jgi:hypothetical protein